MRALFVFAAVLAAGAALAQEGTRDTVPLAPTPLHAKGAEGGPPVPLLDPEATAASGAWTQAPPATSAAPALQAPEAPSGKAAPAAAAGAEPPAAQETGAQQAAVMETAPGRRVAVAQPLAPRAPGPPVSPLGLEACPRLVLRTLITPRETPGSAYEALGIELEALRLCRERQALVLDILELEEEMREALAETAPEPGPRRSAAMRSDVLAELEPALRPAPATAPEPAVRPVVAEDIIAEAAPVETAALSWFSIVGAGGKLRAGVSDGVVDQWVTVGEQVGEYWLVRRISARPPQVVVERGGEREILPYRRARR